MLNKSSIVVEVVEIFGILERKEFKYLYIIIACLIPVWKLLLILFLFLPM